MTLLHLRNVGDASCVLFGLNRTQFALPCYSLYICPSLAKCLCSFQLCRLWPSCPLHLPPPSDAPSRPLLFMRMSQNPSPQVQPSSTRHTRNSEPLALQMSKLLLLMAV